MSSRIACSEVEGHGFQPTGFSPCGAPYVRVPRCVVLEAAAGR